MHEPPDLHDFSDDDQVREVYAFAGLALYFAQVFEQGLIYALYASQVVDGTLVKMYATADEFEDEIRAKTAGQILSRFRQHFGLSADLERLCDEALRLRNFLAHRFFFERAELFMHVDGRQLMLSELHAAGSVFEQADAELEAVMFDQGKRFGLTREAVTELFEALQREAHPGGRPVRDVVSEIMSARGLSRARTTPAPTGATPPV